MIRNIPFNMKNNAEKGKESVERLMEYLMDQPINPIGKVSGVLASFRVDILEDETQYEIQAELPGFIRKIFLWYMRMRNILPSVRAVRSRKRESDMSAVRENPASLNGHSW